MTRAELVAVEMVNRLYADLVDPGGFAGPSFNPETFNVGKHISAHFILYYSRKIPTKTKENATQLAVKLWNDKIAHLKGKS